MGKLTNRIKSLFGVGGETSWRGPIYGIGEFGNAYPLDSLEMGWQRNLTVSANGARHVPAVYASVMTIARTVSQCYPVHQRKIDGVPENVTTSAAYRVLRRPNTYQTGPEFLLNLVATALFEGEAFCICTRNNRQEIESMHLLPPGSCSPLIDEESRAIFYSVGANPLAPGGAQYIAPQREVYHLKFHTPRHPLVGESPLKAAALAIGINVALNRNQAAFFDRMNRPSGVLTTEAALNRGQIDELRDAFDNQSKKWASGGMPILSNGLKFQPLSISSQDAELVKSQSMSAQEIYRVFGVPGPLVGDMQNATLSNAETLIHNFLSMSLGSYLETIERGFDVLFGLGQHERIELDVSALLRTDFAGRIDGLTKAVQGGLLTPDEARAKEGFGPIKGGASAYLQRQMTPIDKISELLESEGKPDPVPQPAVVEPVVDVAVEESKSVDPEFLRLKLADMLRTRKAVA